MSHRRKCARTVASASGAAPTIVAGMPLAIAKKLKKLRQVGLASAWQKHEGVRGSHRDRLFGIGFCNRWNKDYIGTADLKPLLLDCASLLSWGFN